MEIFDVRITIEAILRIKGDSPNKVCPQRVIVAAESEHNAIQLLEKRWPIPFIEAAEEIVSLYQDTPIVASNFVWGYEEHVSYEPINDAERKPYEGKSGIIEAWDFNGNSMSI